MLFELELIGLVLFYRISRRKKRFVNFIQIEKLLIEKYTSDVIASKQSRIYVAPHKIKELTFLLYSHCSSQKFITSYNLKLTKPEEAKKCKKKCAHDTTLIYQIATRT